MKVKIEKMKKFNTKCIALTQLYILMCLWHLVDVFV